jgi:hypothetical protein
VLFFADGKDAEKWVHVEHAQCIANHKNSDTNQQDGTRDGIQLQHRAERSQQETQQGVGCQFRQQENGD